MRKIIVYIATSADGFIARPNGAVDWLDRPRPKGNYGMGELRHLDDGRRRNHRFVSRRRRNRRVHDSRGPDVHRRRDSVDRAGSQERSVVAARLEEVAVVRLHYLVRGG